MRNIKHQYFLCAGRNFTGIKKFQGHIHMEPKESPDDGGFGLHIAHSHL